MSSLLAPGAVLRRAVPALLAAVCAATCLATAGPATAAVSAPALVVPGSDVLTLDVTTPGAPASVSFEGVRGRIPTVQVLSSSLASAARLDVTSGRRALGSLSFTGPAFKVYPALPSGGRWSLDLAPAAGATGQVSLLLSWATGAPQQLSPGALGRVRITAPGDVQVFAVPVVTGRRPTLTVPSAAFVSTGGATQFPNALVSLFRPDGRSWGFFQTLCATCPDQWFEGQPDEGGPASLTDVPGTWLMPVRTGLDVVGTATLRLSLVADQRATIRPRRRTAVRIAERGQSAIYSFAGATGQRPVLDILGQVLANTGQVDIVLRRPDGTEFTNFTDQTVPEPANQWFEGEPLDATGTWTLTVDPVADTLITATYVFDLVTDPKPVVATFGAPLTLTVPRAGVNPSFTVDGTPGDRLVLDVSASSWSSLAAGGAAGSGSVTVFVHGADGVGYAFTTGLPGSGAAVVDLPAAVTVPGPWTVTVDADRDTTGTVTLTPRSVRDVSGNLVLGAPTQVTTTEPFQQARFDLGSPTSGLLLATVSGLTTPGTRVFLVDSIGQQVGDATFDGDGTQLLAGVGQFSFWPLTLVVDPPGTSTASLSLTVSAR